MFLQIVFIKREQNLRARGNYKNNDYANVIKVYKDDIKLKTEQPNNTEHRKMKTSW